MKTSFKLLEMRNLLVLVPVGAVALSVALVACGDGARAKVPFQVGTVTYDPALPPEPSLPTPDQVCTTLYASDALVKRPDGALPPEADLTPAVGAGVDSEANSTIINPDWARLQAALNACGALVDAEVGASIAAADAAFAAAQAAGQDSSGLPLVQGIPGEELAKPQYRGSRFAVRLVKSQTGAGDSFITGPLVLPSGVTLWIDQGVTVFATRDVMAYKSRANTNSQGFCGNVYARDRSGSSGNCRPLIGGNNVVNTAVVGDGSIDSRAYAEIVSSDPKYPLLKVDLTCTNTYAAYATTTTRAANGTPCDNGGTFVDARSTARNMTWWDLAWLGNMVENGRTGQSSQSNFRMMFFQNMKNFTLYRITLNNSANFHVVPQGVDGLTVWGVKLQTPSLAAYANPAGNGNPLYTGVLFNEDNVKNTDAFDPAAMAAPSSSALTIGGNPNQALFGAAVTSGAGPVHFDGYLKNVVFAFNYVSTGDDDIVLKGNANPSPALATSTALGMYGVDGNRDVRSDRAYGIVVAHNHIYWGHGISVGSETNGGVANVQVYDNSFDHSEEGLRVKSDFARGGKVANIHYQNICIRNALNALLFTPYYSTRAVPDISRPLYPDFHDLHLRNVRIIGESNVRLEGFQANQGYAAVPANPRLPLVMELDHVVADSPDQIVVTSSDAELTLDAVNLPVLQDGANRVNVSGRATRAVDPNQTVDCSRAFVDFPTRTSPFGTTW
jgi:polygalacturonase